MKFKEYIINEGRSKPINVIDARKWIDKHGSKAFERAKLGNKIYRGVSGIKGDYFIIDPKKGKPRRSAYVGSNFYTLLMDNLPSWKQYPKRSQSVICTTDLSKANDYASNGQPYIVIPKDGSKIGVCNDDDIFTSFPYLFKSFKNKDGSTNTLFRFSDELKTLESYLPKSYNSDKSWSSLVKMFKEIDSTDEVHQELLGLNKYWFSKITGGDSLKKLESFMEPKKNKFSLKKAGDLIPYDKEVWTDGECVLLSPEAFEVISGEDFDEGDDFELDIKISELKISEKELGKAYSNLAIKSYRDKVQKNPFPTVTHEGNMVVDNEGAVILAILKGETYIDTKVEWQSYNYYVHDEWEYRPQLKFKGLEVFSDEETLEYDQEDWV